MRITNIFDAVREGTYSDFLKFYTGDSNLFNKYAGLSLLQLAFVNDHNTDEKIKMIQFLLSEGADVNYKSPKDQRNALHIFYFSVMRPDPQYMLKATQLLVEAGVDINGKDKYGAIPLKYAITVVKLPTEAAMPVYQYLIDHGSNICEKDNFGKTCLDYAKEFHIFKSSVVLSEENSAPEHHGWFKLVFRYIPKSYIICFEREFNCFNIRITRDYF